MIDLTTGTKLSTANIEQTVSSAKPYFIETKDNSVEYAFGFPNMMYTLWGFICTFRYFPTQKAFADYYLCVHEKSLDKLDNTAVKARVLRSYPSLVRELHLYALAKESGRFPAIVYSAYNDIEQGIDLQVELGGREYNVSCFVLTKRSLEFRQKKQYRHKKIVNSIELGLDLQSGKNINGWKFFDLTHVDTLLNMIINYAWTHYRQHPLDLLSVQAV